MVQCTHGVTQTYALVEKLCVLVITSIRVKSVSRTFANVINVMSQMWHFGQFNSAEETLFLKENNHQQICKYLM